jgi:hypothetical protein
MKVVSTNGCDIFKYRISATGSKCNCTPQNPKFLATPLSVLSFNSL